jgi:hypothetical protein
MYFLRQQETIRYKMKPDEMDILSFEYKKNIHDVINAERLDNFPAKEGNQCQFCDYFDLCPAKRHKKMLEESQSDEELAYTPEQLKEKADVFLETDFKFKQLKQEYEKQKEELKEITRQTGLKVLEGDRGQVKISLSTSEKFVTKSQDANAFTKLTILCRDLGLDNYFIPDTNAIVKEVYQRKLIPEEQLKHLEEFIKTKEMGRVTVKLIHESEEGENLA